MKTQKTQWTLIAALLFATLIAIFAVMNVNDVDVKFGFGTASIPLILIIFGSALLGGLSIGLLGIIRQFQLQRTIRTLEKEVEDFRSKRGMLHFKQSHPDGGGNAGGTKEKTETNQFIQ